ncbi:Regulator of protease activity HflC [Commensalibacter communis]|uniref:SPFH domain-containing protein n=1 Tax=Commensalibacter communis TaxID=2972786 RepID=UPI0022FFC3D3|nr:SPFH domain-containing protein [Commensalibacter communis]CAI3928743.1 Regulator of protease activity HflC [Commensalibacter communis]
MISSGISTGLIAIIIILFAVVMTLFKGVRIVPQGQQWIIERLGKYKETLGAGLNIVVPYVDRVAYRLSNKDQILEVPSQDVITKDNAVVTVNAICFVKIADPQKAAYGVEDYEQATASLAMTSLRATIGKMDLDESLSSRDMIKAELLGVMSDQMTDWGLILRSIEIQDIAPSPSMQGAMEQQAAAERQRKATETRAAGNKQAAILEAEGIKQSTILRAEAEQESATRQAAAAISLAEGTKRANQLLAESISGEGGQAALNFQLATRYVDALSALSQSNNTKVVAMPSELSQSIGSLINAGVVLGTTAEVVADKKKQTQNQTSTNFPWNTENSST